MATKPTPTEPVNVPNALNSVWTEFEAICAANGLGAVAAQFRSGFFNPENSQEAGLQPLIGLILIAGGAFGPGNSGTILPAPGQDANSSAFKALETKHMRRIFSVAWSADQIVHYVATWWSEGSNIYPKQSIRTVISRMVRIGLLGTVSRPVARGESRNCYWLRTDAPPLPVGKRGFKAAPMPRPTGDGLLAPAPAPAKAKAKA